MIPAIIAPDYVNHDDLREILLGFTYKKISDLEKKVNELQNKHDKHRQNFMFILVFICASICFPHFKNLIVGFLIGSLIGEYLSGIKEDHINYDKAFEDLSEAYREKDKLYDLLKC